MMKSTVEDKAIVVRPHSSFELWTLPDCGSETFCRSSTIFCRDDNCVLVDFRARDLSYAVMISGKVNGTSLGAIARTLR
jgi:hypothetical protein